MIKFPEERALKANARPTYQNTICVWMPIESIEPIERSILRNMNYIFCAQAFMRGAKRISSISSISKIRCNLIFSESHSVATIRLTTKKI